jgi:6-bladed beta-propeller
MLMNQPQSRREFGKNLLKTAIVAAPSFHILKAQPKADGPIVGHGKFQYRVNTKWGNLDAAQFPVKNCHEMVMDSKGRLIMVTDETKNNILIYDRSGKLLENWSQNYADGHGLTLWNANGEEFLFICSPGAGKVVKTDLKGTVLMELPQPSKIGAYDDKMAYRPTETCVGLNGDIYVADGYGSQFVLQFNQKGEFIRKFGGAGDGDAQFSTAHGVAIDYRDAANPTLLVTSRGHNSFKRFTLDGTYISTIFLPGAFVCRPVLHGQNLFAGVCWSRLRYLNQTPNSGFVTILDSNNRVVSNPGGTKPVYQKGELQLMVQDKSVAGILMHCHDVCLDNDDNIYICQWNAKQTYPVKLERI